MMETHIFAIEGCCPMSKNPLPGSTIKITYRPESLILEVAALRAYIDSYIGGRGEIRSMEGMIQQITQHCANATQVHCRVIAELKINPSQEMHLVCSSDPKLSD